MNKLEEIKLKLKAVSDRIEFDAESHTYKVNGKYYKSVSHYQGKFEAPFNSNIAAPTAMKYNRIIRQYKNGSISNVDLEYLRKKEIDIDIHYTKDILLKLWEDKKNLAINIGNTIHEYAECYPNLYEDIPDIRCLQIQDWFKNYFEANGLQLVGFEIPLFSEELEYTGTLDVVLYNPKTDKLIICDYKTNLCDHDEFENKSYKNLLGSLKKYKSTKLNYYSVQQSMYKILLEECSGIEVEDAFLIHISENSWKQFQVVDMSENIKANWGKKIIKGRFAQAEKRERTLVSKYLKKIKVTDSKIKFTKIGSTLCYDGYYKKGNNKILFEVKVHPKTTSTAYNKVIIEKSKFECLLAKAVELKATGIHYINIYKNNKVNITFLDKINISDIHWYKKAMKATTAIKTDKINLKEIGYLDIHEQNEF